MSSRLLNSLVTTEPLARAFSDSSMLASMLRFETALALAEARLGVIPRAAAAAIVSAAAVDAFDATTIAADARGSGTITIPFVRALKARVHAADTTAAIYVHWGATSQDVADTALVLCLQEARAILAEDHRCLAATLRTLAERHAGTVMLARTLLQPAPPTTFGLKAAGWLGAVSRAGAALFRAFDDSALLQFGGASGTLAALGEKGPEVAAGLAEALGLRLPDAPWHVHRDRIASLVAACGIYTAVLGKIARDISLLMQFEVAEAAEPGGGSSTMPHKRNPAGCATVLAVATRAPGLVAACLSGMVQEHERGLGGWHAEASTVATLVQCTGSALAAMSDVADGLSVDPQRMRANLDATHGAVFAERATMLLAPAVGSEAAATIIAGALESSRQSGRSFGEALRAHPEAARALGDAIETLEQPEAYLGSADDFRRRLLDASKEP